jgi:hypothetical protein
MRASTLRNLGLLPFDLKRNGKLGWPTAARAEISVRRERKARGKLDGRFCSRQRDDPAFERLTKGLTRVPGPLWKLIRDQDPSVRQRKFAGPNLTGPVAADQRGRTDSRADPSNRSGEFDGISGLRKFQKKEVIDLHLIRSFRLESDEPFERMTLSGSLRSKKQKVVTSEGRHTNRPFEAGREGEKRLGEIRVICGVFGIRVYKSFRLRGFAKEAPGISEGSDWEQNGRRRREETGLCDPMGCT